ncbi:MAG: hypothetical protein ACP6IP_06750 [Candidatus Njordarchaeia archaeon]
MVKITVDIWKTGLHGVEVGIKKKEEHRAKSRKFTRDMDIFGEVKLKEGKKEEKYGYVAYRKELWEKEDLFEKRIDIRLFTDTMDWLGTIEENIAKSIVLTLVNDTPSHAFAVTLRDTRVMYQIESIRARFMSGDVFYLTYIDEDNHLRGLILKSKRMTIGSDWEILDALTEKKIMKVDGKVLDFGGRWEIESKKLNDKNLMNIIILFAASLKFYDDLKERTEKLIKNLKKGKKWVKLDKSEVSLFYNPRVRR